MRVALVEDDATYVEVLRDALTELGATTACASGRDEAIALIDGGEFDLVVCDLKLPTTDGDLDLDREHGLAVVAHVLREHPGIPVLVHSEHADKYIMADLGRNNPRADLFGSGREHPMLDWSHKGNIDELVADVSYFRDEIAQLDRIQVNRGAPPIELSRVELRCIRIFARRAGGSIVRVRAMGGGFSDARVLRVMVTDDSGAPAAEAVCKLNSVPKIQDEKRRYELATRLLGAGSYAPLSGEVKAGARRRGALFYSISFGAGSLFDVAQESAEEAARLVPVLRESLEPWSRDRPRTEIRISEVRASLVEDRKMEELAAEFLTDLDWEAFEDRSIWAERGPQHCDLHGENVLISTGKPLVIDYGEIDEAILVIDPTVLEFSLLFHPKGRAICGNWPSEDQATEWPALEAYVVDCPADAFVVACRHWSTDVVDDPRASSAAVYAYACRQLGYPDTDKDLACAVIQGAINYYNELDAGT